MDFLRLPSPLRRSILQQPAIRLALRSLTTTTLPHDASATTSPSEKLLTLSPATLNAYNLSPPPETTNLKSANSFFTGHIPTLLFSAAYFRSFPPSPFPEVAFLGRSNVGKSSLLNALFGRPNAPIAHVSKRPGRTKTMNGFGCGGEGMLGPRKLKGEKKGPGDVDPAWKRFGRGGLIVVDMPGYGAASREEWGKEIMKYLENRKQLRRTYVLIDTEHGLKRSDVQLLTHLWQQGIAHQVVLSKADKLLFPHARPSGPVKLHNGLGKLRETCEGITRELNDAAGELGGRDDAMLDILCCSAEKSMQVGGRSRRIGIDEVRWSVLTACGLEGSAMGKKTESPSKVQDS